MRIVRTAGFTLLEVLVALVVLGFLMVGLSQGVRFGLAAWGTQARIIDRRGDLDAVDRTLRRLVQQMDPGTRSDPPTIAGTEARLMFTSALPMTADAESADMLLAMDAGHRLLLRWTPHLHAKRTSPPPPPRSEVLLSGIERLQLAYWRAGPAGAGSAGAGWVRAWDARSLPALVRIRVLFPPRDHRHWPDLVAAPLRTNPAR